MIYFPLKISLGKILVILISKNPMGLKNEKKKKVIQSYTANHDKRFSPKNVQYPSGEANFFCILTPQKVFYLF